MSHTIEIVVDLREGALVRMLGLIERRGFMPLGIATRPGREAGTLNVALNVETKGMPRSVQVLKRHLRKLHEVRDVFAPAESVPKVRAPEPVAC
ncbi:MAG: ACT domain-containing protein [Myxococcota bacterium]